MKASKLLAAATAILAALLLERAAFAQSRPVAKNITTEAAIDKTVEIAWEFPAKTQPKILGVQIYRRLRPYTEVHDLEGDIPIAELGAEKKSYSDTLSANGSYFYAVLAVTKSGPYKIIIPGMNATTAGVRPIVAAAKDASKASGQEEAPKAVDEALTESQKELLYTDTKMRKAPLPYPGTLLGFDKAKTKMSGQAKKIAAELGSKKTIQPVPLRSPYFFEEDMFSPDSGDEYTLFETLRAGLAPKKYAQSVKLLQDFLSVHRSKETTERAQFYLGQSHYFCGDYKSAIRCFLTVQDAFPELSKQWIDSSLDLLVLE